MYGSEYGLHQSANFSEENDYDALVDEQILADLHPNYTLSDLYPDDGPSDPYPEFMDDITSFSDGW